MLVSADKKLFGGASQLCTAFLLSLKKAGKKALLELSTNRLSQIYDKETFVVSYLTKFARSLLLGGVLLFSSGVGSSALTALFSTVIGFFSR